MNAARRARTADAVLARFGPAVLDRRVYVVRGTDLQWHAKRLCDGEVVAKEDSRGGAKSEAELLGYSIVK